MTPTPRLLGALAVFAVLAAPSWPGTVDDVYITLTYARRWAETGALEWTTGERVEGYSNFLFMAMMALGALARLDIDLLAQIVAFLSAAGVIVMVERRLPRTGGGGLALLALVGWAPFNHWSMIGLEATFYGLLLAAGWACALGASSRWGVGIALLAAASMTRPEGALHLLAGASTLILRPASARGARGSAMVAVLGLATYHGARIAWFGSPLPTSYLVKVAPIGLTPYGALQLAGDLLTAGGIIAALMVVGTIGRRDVVWVCLPLAIQSATLLRASGDWMSWGRLTLPGVLASVAAFTAVATWRQGAPRWLVGATALVVGIVSWLEPRGYGAIEVQWRSPSEVARFVGHLRHGLDTPVAEDVSWVIDHVPVGAAGLVVDAGILGDVPGFELIDMRGLTHRPAAEAIAAGRAEEWLRSTVSDPRARPEFLRLANWEGLTHPEYPKWLVGGYTLREDLRYGGGSIRWYATTEERPSASERRDRWDEMLRRHPSQPFLAWRAALSAADTGDSARAERLAEEAAARWPSMAEFRDAPRSLSFTAGTQALTWVDGEGFALGCGGSGASRLVHVGEAPRLVVRQGGRTEEPPPQVILDDPCPGAARRRTVTGGVPLPTCPVPRRIRVEVACPSGAVGGVYVHLDG